MCFPPPQHTTKVVPTAFQVGLKHAIRSLGFAYESSSSGRTRIPGVERVPVSR